MSLDLRFWTEIHLVEPENTLRTTVYRRAGATEILTQNSFVISAGLLFFEIAVLWKDKFLSHWLSCRLLYASKKKEKHIQ